MQNSKKENKFGAAISKKKWRRINPFICSGCGKKRMSLKYNRAVGGLCMKCRKNKISENQQKLFT